MNIILKDISSPHSLYIPTSPEAWRSLSLSLKRRRGAPGDGAACRQGDDAGEA